MSGIKDFIEQATTSSADKPPPAKKQKIEQTKEPNDDPILNYFPFDTFEVEIEENSKADLLATIEAQKLEIQNLKRENAKYS